LLAFLEPWEGTGRIHADGHQALKTLTQQRATNTITPLQERAKASAARPAAEASAPAPRCDLNKNQAALYATALQPRISQMAELQQLDCEAVIAGTMTRDQARAASLARALAKDRAARKLGDAA